MQLFMAVLQLVFVAASTMLCAYLFVSLKRDLFRAEQRAKTERESTASRIADLEARMAELRKELESMPPVPVYPVPVSGINLNRRSQALRMLKLGQGPEHVAAALSVPRREVELLVKVQKMLIDSAKPTS